MTRSRKRGTAAMPQSTEQKAVCCRNCMHADLIQYGDDPVLAQCLMKPDRYNERFPYDVDVASTPRLCPMHKYTGEEKWIQKRIKVRHHPMAAYVRTNAAAEPQPTGNNDAA